MTDAPLHHRLDPRGKRSFIIFCAVACAIFTMSMVYQYQMIRDARRQTVGDGLHVESYGFDLSNLTVEPDLLVAAGLCRDAQQAMTAPQFDDIALIDKYAKNPWKAIVVSDDAVIGVSINGDDRAYPIRYLNWHEIINDTVGGVPVAVTFSPISRSAVVFDRRVNGEALLFGYSGLIYNNNLVMYDQRAMELRHRPASLWSQLKFEAIAGPMVGHPGAKLTVLPCRLIRWADWKKSHPQTRVLRGDPAMKRKYKRKPYPDAVVVGRPVFPVRPLVTASPSGGASGGGGDDMIAAYRDEQNHWRIIADPAQHPDQLPPDAPIVYARWFAWFAFRGFHSRVD
ncbi:MAG: DUF3179 domain-containing (seleno)protein [Phycisphaeraceae bacterium]